MKDFWVMSMLTLALIGVSQGWTVPLRIATVANSAVVIMNIAKEIKEIKNGKK